MSHHRAILRKALSDAVTAGLLARNVASLAKPPTVPTTERRWLSGDEFADLRGPLRLATPSVSRPRSSTMALLRFLPRAS